MPRFEFAAVGCMALVILFYLWVVLFLKVWHGL